MRNTISRPAADSAQMLNFALAWAPYGSVPVDEVFVRYGLTISEFYRRVLSRLASQPRLQAGREGQRLIEVARAAIGSTKSSRPVTARHMVSKGQFQ